MPSPFPGMDPYIESQGRFHTFHTSFINCCAELLNEGLGTSYFATVDERVLVDATDGSEPADRTVMHRLGPDVAIATESIARFRPELSGLASTTLEPRLLPQSVVSVDQPTQKFVEIRGLPNDRLVTTVELLSPSNKKPGPDREAFLVKRVELLHNGVNLVDIDLLVAGLRISLLAPLPSGDYHAMVTRVERHDRCEVYSWTVRDPLPTIAVPLDVGVPDVSLDLGLIFNRTYERFRFARQLHYKSPLVGPWPEIDRAWATDRATSGQAM